MTTAPSDQHQYTNEENTVSFFNRNQQWKLTTLKWMTNKELIKLLRKTADELEKTF